MDNPHKTNSPQANKNVVVSLDKLHIRKLSGSHIRHNSRPILTGQPLLRERVFLLTLPSLLGQRVFTNLVEDPEDTAGQHISTCLKTPTLSTLEAVTVEVENLPITFVDLTNPS